ncbi:hypothetical protein FE257_009141 [Aspergillus nanangensis]|uniref:Cytochrome P450 n=1 Tax=Aspergillus nanangensis TaxID=2582783 RepID=A0AAD4CYK1_ASPNN|nr:hypothetical protein FE257_009141 [Aspergillus nanangensis]
MNLEVLPMLLSVSPATVTVAVGALVLVYWLATYAYLYLLHPLARYPGPPLAAVSELWYASAWTSGLWNEKIQEAHRRYGDVVRIAPNELSFATAQAFRDIYGVPSKTRKLFPKSDRFYDNGHPNIAFVIDPDERARQHRIFAPQFRPSAVRTQEPIVHRHVDLWLDQIATRGCDGAVALDVSKWFEWLTFDIIGELTFGESFNATRDNKSHPWVSILLDATYSGSIFNLRKRLAFVGPLLRWMPYISPTARAAVESIAQHGAMTLAKTRKRIEAGPARSGNTGNPALVDDFLAHAIRGGMSDTELANQAMVMLTAGAETSATALTAALLFLSQPVNAPCLARLRAEVRGAFTTAADVTGDGTARLPYLNAVLEETLRLFPPSPVGPPRVSPLGGESVDGVFIPGGVIGPRMCIGVTLAWIEMRIALARTVLAFDWELAEDVHPSGDWVEESRLKQLWKKPPLMIRFRPVGKAQ